MYWLIIHVWMIPISPFVVPNGATTQTLLFWPVPRFEASLDPWYIFCSQINQLLPLSTWRKRGVILPSGHKTRLGFDRKKVPCWIVFNRTMKISTDMFWLDPDCFTACNFTNYLCRWSRVATQRSASSAGLIGHQVESLTLVLEAQVRVPSPLFFCKQTSEGLLHRIFFLLFSSPHNNNNTLKEHLF